jgi:arsenical pump membrane protein
VTLLSALPESLARTWPPFVLVAGLLLIGVAAADDRLFEAIGSRISRANTSELNVFSAMMALVAVVTVVVNLDTSVVFLTPILLHVARRRQVSEVGYLYGAVFMSNSASLLLPGSNLTNLLVLASRHSRGASFAGAMITPWVVAVVVTWAVIAWWRRHDWRHGQASSEAAVAFRIDVGVLGVVAALGLMLALSNPALAVLGVGLLVSAAHILRRRFAVRHALRALSPLTLAGLFCLAVALGTFARVWHGPARLMASAGAWGSAALGAGLSNVVNNLPAAVVLSAHPPAHPYALLLGLDLGPNLTVIGALSAVLWWRVARGEGARPSAATFSRVGLVLVPLSLVLCLAALSLVTPGSF